MLHLITRAGGRREEMSKVNWSIASGILTVQLDHGSDPVSHDPKVPLHPD